MQPELHSSNIMVVDDNPSNLKLLEGMLVQRGYLVRSFRLGRLALAAALIKPPDLILLDVNMPEMDGYQVCRRLKATVGLAAIPVIFLSVLNDTEDKVKAFQSGAVDYISKPFNLEEVYTRVETHLNLHHLQQALHLQNQRLEQAVLARTLELAEANSRLTLLDRSKSDFLNLISHELRTPLNGILGVGEIILQEMSSTGENIELRQMFEHSRQRLLALLDDALLLTEIDVTEKSFQFVPVCLGDALDLAIENAAPFAASRGVTIAPARIGQGAVVAEKNLLEKALRALLETAVKFSNEGEMVRLASAVLPNSFQLVVESNGRTIPDAAIPKFFNLFSIAEASTTGGDLGMGSAVAYRILALFGASVGVENKDPSGIRLTILFKTPTIPVRL